MQATFTTSYLHTVFIFIVGALLQYLEYLDVPVCNTCKLKYLRLRDELESANPTCPAATIFMFVVYTRTDRGLGSIDLVGVPAQDCSN